MSVKAPDEGGNGRRAALLSELEGQLRRLEGSGFAKLIPEVGSNLAYALEGAKSPEEVAAVPGRIRNALGRPAFLEPRFGASSHLASMLLELLRRDPSRRCVMNIRYSEGIVSALRNMGREAVFVDRMKEPEDVREREGASVPWVIVQATEKAGRVPDAVYHTGAVGKEAMVLMTGKGPADVVDIALEVAGKV